MTDQELAQSLLTQGMKASKADLFNKQIKTVTGRKKLMHYSVFNFKSSPDKFNHGVFVQFVEYMRNFHAEELESWIELQDLGFDTIDDMLNHMMVCEVLNS